MLELVGNRGFCNNCSHDWDVRRAAFSSLDVARDGLSDSRRPGPPDRGPERPALHASRFSSIDDLVARSGLRRDELVTLADIGALNAFGYDRRSALWQAEQAVRPSGELFDEASSEERAASREACPLKHMNEAERIVADYAGTGLTVGRHPMALRRDELATRGVMRACDLRSVRHGRRVRVAGMVITRQRPGTAKGFVFLTLEDETGVANIIVRPDLFARDRLIITEEPFLIIDGVLQNQDGVTSVRAEQIRGMRGAGAGGVDDIDFDAHDFY